MASTSCFAMTDPDENLNQGHIGNWPVGRNRIETPQQVHAFGMIGLNSALLEETLLLLLLLLLLWYLRPISREDAIRLTGDLNNRNRADWLRALVYAKEQDADVADLMLHAIKCCDICLDNRNMIIHALYTGTDNATENMRLTKRARSNPLRELRFEVSTEKLRTIADDIGNTVNLMIDLWFYHTHRPATVERDARLPLPKKLPQPDRLTIPQPGEDGQSGPTQPRSSEP